MTLANPPQGFYAASAGPALQRPRLSGAARADFCVVGAGYTGLSAALHLAEAGASVTVLEAQEAGFAASGRNGGQIHTGHRKTQEELERWLGPIHARDLWDMSEEAKAHVRALVRAHAIDCDLKDGLVIAAHNRRAVGPLARETEYLSRHYGYGAARMMNAHETARQLGARAYPAARMDRGGGHLHPLNYARGLAAAAQAAGARIFERSRVVAIDEDRAGVNARTEEGIVAADRLLLACDAFSGEIAPQLAPFIGLLESFVTATAPLGEKLNAEVLPCDAAVADTRHVLDYYRKSADGRMLYAGRESYWTTPSDIAAIVRPRMLDVFPQLGGVATEYAWRGTVGITVTRMPHFGRLSKRVLFAHGYSGQGVALATLGGKLLAEAALGRPERFEVFARVPAKPFPGGAFLRKPLVSAALTWFKLMDRL
ncbi:MAG TPA: FAD-binding oxidoreductase [Rhizomicrobium sp.]|nr:FAD-binding oxidoreductase [Rhizomicrobium sp.]